MSNENLLKQKNANHLLRGNQATKRVHSMISRPREDLHISTEAALEARDQGVAAGVSPWEMGIFACPYFPFSTVLINGFCKTQERAFNREITLLQDGGNPGLAEVPKKDLWGALVARNLI